MKTQKHNLGGAFLCAFAVSKKEKRKENTIFSFRSRKVSLFLYYWCYLFKWCTSVYAISKTIPIQLYLQLDNRRVDYGISIQNARKTRKKEKQSKAKKKKKKKKKEKKNENENENKNEKHKWISMHSMSSRQNWTSKSAYKSEEKEHQKAFCTTSST